MAVHQHHNDTLVFGGVTAQVPFDGTESDGIIPDEEDRRNRTIERASEPTPGSGPFGGWAGSTVGAFPRLKQWPALYVHCGHSGYETARSMETFALSCRGGPRRNDGRRRRDVVLATHRSHGDQRRDRNAAE